MVWPSPVAATLFDFLRTSLCLFPPVTSASAHLSLSLSLSLSRWWKRNRGGGMLQASADWGKTAAARRRPLLAAARTGGRTARRRSVGNFSRRRGRAAASFSPPALPTGVESPVRPLSPSRAPIWRAKIGRPRARAHLARRLAPRCATMPLVAATGFAQRLGARSRRVVAA